MDGILPRGPKNFPRLSHLRVTATRIALFDLSLLVGDDYVPTGLRCVWSGIPKLQLGRISTVDDDEFSLVVLAEDRCAGRDKGRCFFKKQNWPPIVPETYDAAVSIVVVGVCDVVIDKGVLGGADDHIFGQPTAIFARWAIEGYEWVTLTQPSWRACPFRLSSS